MKHHSTSTQKELLLLKGEALRLQLLSDTLESKKSIKSGRFVWQMLRSTQAISLFSSLLGHNKKTGVKLSVTALSALLLWLKNKRR